MGLRSRIKDRLGGLLGREPEPAAGPPRPQARTSAPEGPGLGASARPSAPSPAAASQPAAAAPPPKPLSPEEQAKQDKIAAHFEKARRGVLAHLDKQGGSAEMADMHDYSERRFFIAHQAFSRMMEGFVSEGLIDYDSRTGVATITEKGRGYAGSDQQPVV